MDRFTSKPLSNTKILYYIKSQTIRGEEVLIGRGAEEKVCSEGVP